MANIPWYIAGAGIVAAAIAAIVYLFHRFQKVEQGTAIIRTGLGGTSVSFDGIFIVPIVYRMEVMDITVKRVEVDRMGANGLICKDNLRADVKVAFFVRVNKTPQDVLKVAQSLGCRRASDSAALVNFFDAKFSEALKTAGKQFDFVELYTDRMRFKEEILKVIGTDLNGYNLDDAAIDYLEQTPLDSLNPNNILDAEGIKKITELTAAQAVLANNIARDKQKTIKRQDVEAREKILELERQQAEAEQKQAREITEVTARMQAEAERVKHEERLKAQRARIQTDEELAVANENMNRQIIVASRNRERTDKVEYERVEKDRLLEVTERERVVALTQIERDKAIEVEKRNIQEVIRERVAVERTVVEQEQKIKDTVALATAERERQVAVVAQRAQAEQYKVKEVVAAEANKEAAREDAERLVVEAEAKRAAAEKEADARKLVADASAQEAAVAGLGEARAMEAKARAVEQFGAAEAKVVDLKGAAEAAKIRATTLAAADGVKAQGLAEAEGIRAKATADAQGIEAKAAAMKLFHESGREHEEFKLALNKDLQIELAAINIRKDVAHEQAKVLGAALEHARIDIVGGEAVIFDRLVNAIAGGKAVDRWVDNSKVLADVKSAVVAGADGEIAPGELPERLRAWSQKYGITAESVKNLTVSALLAKLMSRAAGDEKETLQRLLAAAEAAGLSAAPAGKML